MGPFVAHGIESEDEALFKTANKLPTHGADEISKHNVAAALSELFTGKKGKYESSTIEEVDDEFDTGLHKRREHYKSQKMDNAKVTFISPSGKLKFFFIDIKEGLKKIRKKYNKFKLS